MKRYVVFGFSLLLWACFTKNPQEKDAKIEIVNLLQMQVKQWNAGSIEGFMTGYVKDGRMQFIGKKGSRIGWQKTLESYKNHYPNKDSMGILAFDLDNIEFLDKNAELGHITGRWKLYRQKDTPNGYFSLITRRTAEGPKIIIDHTW
jgi:hypothetical protein